MSSPAVSFDAPLRQPTTVAVPSGVTFDAPVNTVMSETVPPAGSTTPGPQSQQPQPSRPIATIGPTRGSDPNDPLAAKLELWSRNVESDLMHGTDITGVGRVLKAMGAHGLASGASEEQAKFMGSLPLGLLRMIQGGAEASQHGQRWQGTKDVVGGGLQAATIPSSFVAPDAGEAAGAGLDRAGTFAVEQATKAAKAIKAPFSIKSIQPGLQQNIRSVLNTVAREEGVTPAPTASIRDVATELATAVRQKASAIYKQLDAATGGGRFQRFDEQLQNIQRAIRDVTGIDPDREGALIERWNTVQDAKDAALAEAKTNGVDPKLIDAANATWKRAAALDDLSRHLRMSTSGMRPGLAEAGAKTNPEVLSTTKLFQRMNGLYNTGRLQAALGPERAQQLLQVVDGAHLAVQKIAARNTWIKRGAAVAGLYGVTHAAFDAAHSILSGGQ